MTVAKQGHPPRLYTQVLGEHEHEERKVAWLELFYDLVYVTTLIQLGDALSEDVSLFGFMRFVLLFIPIWWSWTGVTLYINRFMGDDVWHRVLIFLQIFAVAALAISVREAWGSLSIQFTIAYVSIRLILVILYFRAARHVEEASELATRYGTGFFIAALIWLSAVFVPQPFRPYIWLLGMIVDFLVPLSARSQALNRQLPVDVPHLMERYGLFTIIVLGESFIKLITSTAGILLSLPMILFGVFALTITCLLWWIYFDDAADAKIQPTSRAAYVWLYSHLPIALSLIAFGVGVKKLMQEVAESHVHIEYLWLISASMIIYFIFIGLIDAVTVREYEALPHAILSSVRIIGAVLILLLAIFGTELASTPFIAIAALVFVVEVALVRIANQRRAVMSEPSATS